MEQNLPVVAKKVWSLVRLKLFMLKKGINKRKLLLDLNLIIKRGKLAGKALQNLMFNHHHHNWSASARSHDGFTIPPPPRGAADEYEFSCRSTPSYPPSFFKKHHGKKKSPASAGGGECDEIMVDAAMIKALEMVTSPAAGFWKSPAVRQLRITDSPFPVSNGEEDSYVDEAAEKFIMKFYSQLRRQN